jgi:hypothetical protein
VVAAVAATLLLPLLSCSDDLPRGNDVEEGVPVRISLGYDRSALLTAEVNTRAATIDHERIPNTVYDMFLFIFDNNGNLKTKYFFRGTSATSSSTYSTDGDNKAKIDRDKHTISNISTTTGRSRIALIANARTHLTGDDTMFEYLCAVKTFSDLSNVLELENTTEFSTVVMSGYYIDQGSATHDEATKRGGYEVNIYSDGKVGDSGNGRIFLVPTMAKVSVNINCNVRDDADYATFTPTSWQVVNLPMKNYMFYKKEEPEGQEYFTDYSSSVFSSYRITTASESGEDIDDGKTRSFSFYCQSRYRHEDDAQAFATYNDRIKNAPSDATYMVIRGKYEGTSPVRLAESGDESIEKNVNADVTYVVYLGDFSDGDYGDFSTQRNHHYVYEINIKGVDQISVKVFADSDRLDADGDIVVTEPQRYLTVDAHYGTMVVSFDRDEVKAAFKNGTIGYRAITPYGTYSYNADEIHEFIDSQDLVATHSRWVKFKLFDADADHSVAEAYPGDSEYTGDGSKSLWDVRDLMSKFQQHIDDNVIFNNNNTAYFSVYVDEFYYEKEPGTDNEARWRDFVNVNPRKLIIMSRTNTNDNESSSVTEASLAIEQKSIQTVYTTDKSEDDVCPYGWGLEYYEEDLTGKGVLTYNYSTTCSSQSDTDFGRKNMISFLGTRTVRYSDIIDSTTGYLKAGMDAMYACMQRNRDLNGNNIIDEDEIRWYLPAINQYVRMNIGLYGIESNAHLLTPAELSATVKKHYLSSTEGSKQVLWAEEAFSTSSKEGSKMWWPNISELNIRCARNLGHVSSVTYTDNGDVDYNQMYESESITTAEGKKYDVISFKYLNYASTRNSEESTEILGECMPFSYNNRPVRRFAIAAADLSSTYDTATIYSNVTTYGTSPCSDLDTDTDYGWRLPTIAELAIMQIDGKLGWRQYLSRTRYQYPGQNNNRQYLGQAGDGWPISSYKIGGVSDKSYIRCVKDLP